MDATESAPATTELQKLLLTARLEVMPFAAAERELTAAAPQTVVTVTCSPKHGVDHTLDVSARLASRGFAVVPHIAARMVIDRDHVKRIGDRVRSSGHREVFIIGGDRTPPVGQYSSAARLLDELAPEIPGVRIDVAGYPEGHPLIPDEALLAALREKQARAAVIVTQICFDADATVAWIRRIRAAGVHLPVLIGIPGVVNRRRLLELSVRVGVGASARYLRKNFRLARTLLRRSTYDPDQLISKLVPEISDASLGVTGLHLFTFNQVAATEAWRLRGLAPAAGPEARAGGLQ
jgi:methylenetetrahydrofolate reductase (NADPH)